MNRIIQGDCLVALREIEECSIDSVVTDPPYGLEFMSKEWDGANGFRRSLNEADAGRTNAFGRLSKRAPEYRANNLFYEWCEVWARDLWRVLKPGGHMVAFGGSRTYHRLTCAIEDARFEIRDSLMWIYGTGFPKSLNLAGEWDGFGTALKPAFEPIVLARKPLSEGTVAANVLRWRTGALNIGACRVSGESTKRNNTAEMGYHGGNLAAEYTSGSDIGRWPANVVTDDSDEVIAAFPQTKSGTLTPDMNVRETSGWSGGSQANRVKNSFYANEGSAARFFYSAKASKADRAGSKHPTIKPVALMQWLCRLVTPPGGIVLDPFAGSGTTAEAALAEGFSYVLIEQNQQYIDDIRHRLNAANIQYSFNFAGK